MDTFQVHILAADRTLYEGPCVSLTIPASDGERGILAHHAGMMAAIVPGRPFCRRRAARSISWPRRPWPGR